MPGERSRFFPYVPEFVGSNVADWAKYVTNTTNNTANGRINNTGTFTLAANTISTDIVLAEGRIGVDTLVVYFPKTATAATAFGSGGIFVSTTDVLNNTFSLTHPNTADADKIFQFALLG